MVDSYQLVDKQLDGLLAAKFVSKHTDFCFLLIGMYLPPEQSTWGRDALSFYAHLLKLVYEFSYCDNLVLAGDTNSKLGAPSDFIPEIDDVKPWQILMMDMW